MLSMGLVRSSKVTAKGLVITLAAGLLGTGVVIIGAASPASAEACGAGSSNALYSGTAGQDGSSTTTAYRISTAADLIRISNTTADWTGKFFLQTADINLAGCEWTAIGVGNGTDFTGQYDGGFFTISGLNVVASVGNPLTAGLFGLATGATFKNMKIMGATVAITTDAEVGILVGRGQSVSIDNVVTSGTITSTSTNSYTGGIAGLIRKATTASTIVNSYSSATVSSAGQYTGGFVGRLSEGTLSNSYARGAVTGVGDNVGGLSGGVYDGVFTNAFYDEQTSTQPSNNLGTAKTTANMKSFSTFAAWPIVDGWAAYAPSDTPAKIWGICSSVNNGYPFLLWEYTTDACYVAPPAPASSGSSGPSMPMPTADVAAIFLTSGPGNRSVVRIELTKTPSAVDSLFVVVRLLDFSGRLLEELRVSVPGNSSALEVPIDRNMGQFDVVAFTSNAVGATAAVSVNPQTVKQRAIRKATEKAPRRLTGKSLNRDVVFTADSAALSPQMKRTLRQAARLAKASDSRVAVTGFAAASPKGTKFEKRLAERRALRVANFLRKQGLENWIYFHGLNSRQGSDFAGQLRRVEIRVLK